MNNIKWMSVASALSMVFSSSALAAPIVFDLVNPNSRTGIVDSTYASGYNYTRSGLGLSVTGWSYGVNTISTPQHVCNHWTNWRHTTCNGWNNTPIITQVVDDSIEQALVGKWAGLGDEKASTPNHAIDNEGGDYDMLLLSFDKQITLNSIDLGWKQGDADVSMMAFNGNNFNSSSLLGKKWQNLLGNGWQSAGNYYNLNLNTTAVNPLHITSQYWLIGAFNPLLSALANDATTDYFKLEHVTVEVPVRLPEPNIILLLSLGLVSLGLVRRNQV